MPSVTSIAAIESSVPAVFRFVQEGRSRKILLEVDDCFGLSPFAHARAVIAGEMTHAALLASRAYLVVLETGVFDSYELPGLYERVRRSEGIAADIERSEIDVCEFSDKEYLQCLLGVALNNAWDVLLCDEACTLVVYFSHDDWFALIEAPSDLRKLLEKIVKAQGARRVNRRERRLLTGG